MSRRFDTRFDAAAATLMLIRYAADAAIATLITMQCNNNNNGRHNGRGTVIAINGGGNSGT